MKTNLMAFALAIALSAGMATAQEKAQTLQPKAETSGTRMPPPQAYEDCKGKAAGDSVLHTTREGKVPATCAESSNGLVARPVQPKAGQASTRTP